MASIAEERMPLFMGCRRPSIQSALEDSQSDFPAPYAQILPTSSPALRPELAHAEPISFEQGHTARQLAILVAKPVEIYIATQIPRIKG